MAHVTVELHEKYACEKISDFDHAVVHEEMAAIGCTQDGEVSGQSKRVIRGSYIADAIQPASVATAHENIERRLGRRASVMVSIGQTYAYGLKPVPTPTLGSLFASPADSLRPLMAAPTNAYSNLASIMGTPSTPLTRLAGLTPSNSVWATVPASGPPAPTGGLARLILEMGKNS